MDRTDQGFLFGLIGVLIFGGSMPATRAAVGGFDPLFLTAARGSIAAMAAALPLLAYRQKRPVPKDLAALLLVGACVVVGFPLLSSMALRHIPAARGLLFTGLLPLSTALFAVIRCGERPRPLFWLFALAGACLVIGFAWSGGSAGSLAGDLLMGAAVLICGLGYAEGAALSRRLGGWQVICWALLLAAPAMLLLALVTQPASFSGIPAAAWIGLGYVSLFSMLIGFIFWYRGLALGGAARIGQLQLLQPLVGFVLAAVLLGEPIGIPLLAVTGGVLLCVGGARRFA